MNRVMRMGRLALVASLALGLWGRPATADDTPHTWKGSATGTTKPGAGVDVDAFGGNASPFGPFTGAGMHVLDPATFHFVGSAVWTTSRGDKLYVNYSGDLSLSGNPLYPFAFKGILNADGGTGRLKHAKGSAVWMGGFTGSPGNYFFVFDGTLDRVGDVDEGMNFKAEGRVGFANILKGTLQDGVVPYSAIGTSRQIGLNVQTGSIRNLTGLVPIDATTFVFLGEVGPHPFLAGSPAVHLIATNEGTISCTWTAVFTLKIVNANGDAVFSGDGDFQIVGGTGRYRHASGRFRTFFETGVVPFGSDQAVAAFEEKGKLHRP